MKGGLVKSVKQQISPRSRAHAVSDRTEESIYLPVGKVGYSSSNIRLAIGPMYGISYLQFTPVSKHFNQEDDIGDKPVQRISVSVRIHDQPADQNKIAQEENPAQEARPQEEQM